VEQSYPVERIEYSIDVDYSCEDFGSNIFPTSEELEQIENATDTVLEEVKNLFLSIRQSSQYE
jgi:hypothetical protein